MFGSTEHAEQWSDDLRTASVLAHYATVLATPSGNDAGDWIISKSKGVLVGIGGRVQYGRDHARLENCCRSRASERRRRRKLPIGSYLDQRRAYPPGLAQSAGDRHAEECTSHARCRALRADDRHFLGAHRSRMALSRPIRCSAWRSATSSARSSTTRSWGWTRAICLSVATAAGRRLPAEFPAGVLAQRPFNELTKARSLVMVAVACSARRRSRLVR